MKSETQVCTGCKKPKPLKDYWTAGIVKGKRYKRKRCKVCYNKTKYNYKFKIRKWFQEYKESLKCSRCGYSKEQNKGFSSHALQFHHVKDKSFEISNAISRGYAMKRIINEIKKCVVLCARCHAEHHDTRI